MKKNLIGAAVAALVATFATAASAQSSVTLYGVVDAGLTFVNNVPNVGSGAGVKANKFALSSGNVQESRWGLTGKEDLGGGMKAIFKVESGFDVANGSLVDSGKMFNRQAYVGLSSDMGTVTLGRQYDSVVDYLGPLSAAGTWGGTYFGHAFGNDNLNSDFSIANAIKYQSANYAGFSFNGLYGFSNQAGAFANNRAYSVGAGYSNGALKLGAAYTQGNGVNGQAGGAITGDQFASAEDYSGSRQRTFGAGASYAVNAMTFGLVWTQSRLDDSFDNSLNLNNIELNGRFAVNPALALGAAYTYSFGKSKNGFGGSSDTVHYQQFGLQADYSLSKRTDFYVEGVVQVAGGSDGLKAAIANQNGAFGASTSNRQVVVSTGIRHRF